jgi:hypothetical protein
MRWVRGVNIAEPISQWRTVKNVEGTGCDLCKEREGSKKTTVTQTIPSPDRNSIPRRPKYEAALLTALSARCSICRRTQTECNHLHQTQYYTAQLSVKWRKCTEVWRIKNILTLILAYGLSVFYMNWAELLPYMVEWRVLMVNITTQK